MHLTAVQAVTTSEEHLRNYWYKCANANKCTTPLFSSFNPTPFRRNGGWTFSSHPLVYLIGDRQIKLKDEAIQAGSENQMMMSRTPCQTNRSSGGFRCKDKSPAKQSILVHQTMQKLLSIVRWQRLACPLYLGFLKGVLSMRQRDKKKRVNQDKCALT